MASRKFYTAEIDFKKYLWQNNFACQRTCNQIVGGLFVTYPQNVVDGIFVGQGVGSAALGAVNTGVPFITFVVAVAAMFPIGGATVVAIRMSRGDKVGANHAFMTAFSLSVLLSVLPMIVGMAFSTHHLSVSARRKFSQSIANDFLEIFLFRKIICCFPQKAFCLTGNPFRQQIDSKT